MTGEGCVAVFIDNEEQCQAVMEAVPPDKRPPPPQDDEKMLLQVPFDSLLDMREFWGSEERRQMKEAPNDHEKIKIAKDPLAYWYDK